MGNHVTVGRLVVPNRSTDVIARLSMFLVVALLGAAAEAQEFRLGSVTIIDPWSRALPPTAPNGAAYFRIENRGPSADRIIAARTAMAERAELHTHEMEGGLMAMRRVESVEVPIGGEVSFKPHGLHVMLFGLRQPLVDGERFDLALVFEKAGEIEVSVDVRRTDPSAATGHEGHKHGQTQ